MFSAWCAGRQADPVHCPVAAVLEFLQSLLDSGRSRSAPRVFVAAISSLYARFNTGTVGSHELVARIQEEL